MAIQVAAAQIEPRLGEVDANLARIERAVSGAAAEGAALVVLPECATTGYCFDTVDEALAVARRATPVTEARLSDLARQLGVAIICGTLEAEGSAVANTALMLGADGSRARYVKTHLPFLGVDRFATPGSEPPPVVELAGMRVGVLICYDLRFPEAARICALEGADLIALPTNWPVGVQFHPGIFAPSRAAENHVYVLACDRVGTENGTTFIGHSVFIDYDGNAVATAGETDEQTIFGDIDLDAVRQTHVRPRPGEHEWDTMADRRPGLYARLLEPAVDRAHPLDATHISADAGDSPS